MNLRNFCAALLLCAPLAATAESQPEPVPLVKVDDFAVTNLHLAIFNAQEGNKPTDANQQITLLNELVNTFMVANSAEGKAFARQAEIAAAMEVANARLVAQALIRDHLQNIEVSEEDLKAAYEAEYAGRPGVELKARHILLKTEDDAKAVITELQQGADFAELAKTRSTGPSSAVGGDLGWFAPDQMVGAFSEALLEMENGAYSQTPVQTQFGWHVIRREDSRPVPIPTLDDVRDELEEKVRTASLGRFIRSLRDKAAIEVIGADAEVVE